MVGEPRYGQSLANGCQANTSLVFALLVILKQTRGSVNREVLGWPPWPLKQEGIVWVQVLHVEADQLSWVVSLLIVTEGDESFLLQ